MALAKESQPTAKRCKTCLWYEQLSKSDKVAFDQWIDNGGSREALYRACRRAGLAAARSRFGDHMREHREPS